MQGLVLFLQAVLVGLAISAPPGPVGALCVGRTVEGSLRAGLASAAGAVLADTLYGVLAALGVTHLFAPTGWATRAFALLAVPVFALLGIAAIRKARRGPSAIPPAERTVETAKTLTRHAGTTFLLTLATPTTLPALIAIFAALGLAGQPHGWDGVATLGAGVCVGAALWWVSLCLFAHTLRGSAETWARRMNYAGGVFFLLAAGRAAWAAIEG